MNLTSSLLSDVVDNVNTPKDIAQCFCEKYNNVYTSVPTNEDVLNHIDFVVNDRLNCIIILIA